MIANSCYTMMFENQLKNGASLKNRMSKRNLKQSVLLVFFALFGLNAIAQDVIILKNGDEITAIVQEIDITEVEYKKWDNQAGPIYTLNKEEIFMIEYVNGDKDVFMQAQQVQQPDLPVYKYTFGNQISSVGSEKDPFFAGFLSLLIPGAGQFYVGDIGGGLFYLSTNVVSNLMWMTAGEETTFSIGLVCALTVNIASIVDAAVTAKKVNKARGYYLGNNMHLKVNPTLLKTNDFAQQNFKNSAYGLSFAISF